MPDAMQACRTCKKASFNALAGRPFSAAGIEIINTPGSNRHVGRKFIQKEQFMRFSRARVLPETILFAAFALQAGIAQPVHHIQTVFVIVMENHNWTGAGSSSLANNPAAPYINYTLIPMASYARDYKNPPSIHPSLPNYIRME